MHHCLLNSTACKICSGSTTSLWSPHCQVSSTPQGHQAYPYLARPAHPSGASWNPEHLLPALSVTERFIPPTRHGRSTCLDTTWRILQRRLSSPWGAGTNLL